VTSKHTNTLYSLSASLGRVAEAQWFRVCETVRRSSPSVGPLGEGKAYLEGNFLSQAPPDLPSETNIETINNFPPSNSSSGPLSPPGPYLPTSNTTNPVSTAPAPDSVRERGRERESVRGTTIKIPSTETLEKIADELRNSLALPAGLTITTKDKANSSQTSLVPIPQTALVLTSSPSQSVQSLVPTPATEESTSNILAPKTPTTQTREADPSTTRIAQLQANTVEALEQTPKSETPAPTATAELSVPSSPVKSLKSRKSNVTLPPRTPTPPTAPTTHAEALERIAESFQNPAPTSVPRTERPPSRPFQRVASPPTQGQPESVASPLQPQRADTLPLSQPVERINSPPVQIPAPGGVFRERGERERERPHSIAVANAIPFRDVQRPIPRSPPTQEQPLQSQEYDRAARTRSIDSTFVNGTGNGSSGGGHVANLRDRWNDRQVCFSFIHGRSNNMF
jgi:hypothetical protein